MKLCYSLFLGLLLFTGTAISQTALTRSDAPDLLVSKISWQKEVFVPALYDDPMQPNQEQVNLKREQKIIARANNVRVQGGQNPLPLPTREVMSANRKAPDGPSVSYLYKAKITNTGAKTIKALIWEYVVIDENGVQVGTHTFIDNRKIRTGRTAGLVAYSSTPPVNVITAESAKDSRHQYSERVIIDRIEYDDGTYWQRPDPPVISPD
jgi:hypothetical protein